MNSAEIVGDRQILDSSLAFDAALLEQEGRTAALQAGVPAHLLGEVIEAHGDRWTVAEAMGQCPPFAQMLGAVASSVPEEFRDTVLAKTISKMAASTADEVVPDAVRARVAAVEESNNSVKKN